MIDDVILNLKLQIANRYNVSLETIIVSCCNRVGVVAKF